MPIRSASPFRGCFRSSTLFGGSFCLGGLTTEYPFDIFTSSDEGIRMTTTTPTITRTPNKYLPGKRYDYTVAYKGHTMQARTADHAKSLAGWLKRQVDLEERQAAR